MDGYRFSQKYDEGKVSAMAAGQKTINPRVIEEYKAKVRQLVATQQQKHELLFYKTVEDTVITSTSVAGLALPLVKVARVSETVTVGRIALEQISNKGSFTAVVAGTAGALLNLPLGNFFSADIDNGIEHLEDLEKQQIKEMVVAAEAYKTEIVKTVKNEQLEEKATREIDRQVDQVVKEEMEAGKALEDALKGVQDFVKKIMGLDQQAKSGQVSAQSAQMMKTYQAGKAKMEATAKACQVRVQAANNQLKALRAQRAQHQARWQQATNLQRQMLERPPPFRRIPIPRNMRLEQLTQQVFRHDEQLWREFMHMHQSLFGNRPPPVLRYMPPPLNSPPGRQLIDQVLKRAVDAYLRQLRYVP